MPQDVKKKKKKKTERSYPLGSPQSWASRFYRPGYTDPEDQIADGWKMIRKGLKEWNT